MDSLTDPYTPPKEADSVPSTATDRSFRWVALTLALAHTVAVVASGIVARPRFVPGLTNMAFQLFTSWLFMFPVSLPLAGWLAWLCIRARVGSSTFDWERLHWLAVPAMIPLFCLAWGVVFRHGRRSTYPDWQHDVILYTLLVCFVSAITVAIVNRKHRWIAVSGGLNCFLLCFGAAVLAGMSVSGDRL